jgi:hypothetical protein
MAKTERKLIAALERANRLVTWRWHEYQMALANPDVSSERYREYEQALAEQDKALLELRIFDAHLR